ncbi:MAG: phosphoethanolamine--lipid A transferase [Bdellovibrionales bacterium]|nr:phosphoethanolamine--lipid A transferase [Bdellovibrionales bacterium]
MGAKVLPHRRRFSVATVLLLATSIFVLTHNTAFFAHVTEVYPLNIHYAPFILSLALVLGTSTYLVLAVLCVGRATKPILTVLLLLSAAASYYMNRYGVVIDHEMVRNVALTDSREVRDVVHWGLVLHLILLGVVPAVVLMLLPVERTSFLTETVSKLKFVLGALALTAFAVVPISDTYFSFLREHKILRYYANPTGWLYATFKFLKQSARSPNEAVAPLGEEARVHPSDVDRELIIVVVGETARADHFSLNGYERQTNPKLQAENVLSFTNVSSCGTSTAVSVPCMFSNLGRAGYSQSKGANTENVLDVLQHAGISVLWRDNNSDSKGVAERVPFEDFRSPQRNPICDVECRDEGMLAGLDNYIEQIPEGDIVIVLHAMGNHGPAYFKRYPAAFEQFTPACKSAELDTCSPEEIRNAYDNAILYTDHFLSEVIRFLKPYSSRFETAMLYLSDHGESLGEAGVFLHGMPYFIAPDAQTHVAAIVWFGSSFEIDTAGLRSQIANPYSHDNLFHSLLGLLEIEDPVYDKGKDIFAGHYTEEDE